jgi:hypothetical protein
MRSWLLDLTFNFLAQVKEMLKRQGQSSKITSEQMQKKLAENGISKDDLCKNIPVNTTARLF